MHSYLLGCATYFCAKLIQTFAKKHSGVQEDGHEEMLQEATHELFSVQADGGEQGGCPHSRVMQPHVEDFDCCCLKGTCPWLHEPL